MKKIILVAAAIFTTNLLAATVQLTPSHDNTIYSEYDDNGTPANPEDDIYYSNGPGQHMYCGRMANGNYRRALLNFDLTTTIPSGSLINSASLTLHLSKSHFLAHTINLHKVTADWGESISSTLVIPAEGEEYGAIAEIGEATWKHTFFNTYEWSTLGGDYKETASASTEVDPLDNDNDANNFFTWESTALKDDVQSWLGNPAENFGWIIIGYEGNFFTMKQFDSKDNDNSAYWPVLTINYTPPVTFTNGADPMLNFVQSAPIPPVSNWPVGQFTLTGSASGAILNSIEMVIEGAYQGLDGNTPLELYTANSNNFASATAIGTPVGISNNTASFTGLNSSIPNGTRYYWLTADLSAQAKGNINAKVIHSAAISLTNGKLGATSDYGMLNAGTNSLLPVELAHFKATQKNQSVLLQWMTLSETNCLGYTINRKFQGTDDWQTIADFKTDENLTGNGTTQNVNNYSFIDNTTSVGSVDYQLLQTDQSGQVHTLKKITVEVNSTPILTRLHNAYPNPFNPSTQINYTLAQDEHVNLSIYNSKGQLISTLINAQQTTGEHTIAWHAEHTNGQPVTSGVYFVYFQTQSNLDIQKILFIK